MNNLLEKIGSVIISAALVVGGWFGADVPQKEFAGSTSSSDVIALFETTLASRITDTATTLTLTSATDKDGNTLASSTYGLIIDEGTAVEELVLADCTATACTNLTRGLSVRTGTTTVAALKQEHRRGASVKITDAPSLIFATNVFRGRQNIERVMNYDTDLSISSTSRAIPYASWVIGQTNTASTSAKNTVLSGGSPFTSTTTFNNGLTLGYSIDSSSDALDVANKSYVDAVGSAGASDANQTTKGIVEEATVPEINSGASVGGTGAKLFMTPAAFAVSNFASTTVLAGIASTTSSASYVYGGSVNMTANDTLILNGVCYSTVPREATLRIRPSFNSSSTTIGYSNTTDGLQAKYVQGAFTATTTATVYFDIILNDACAGISNSPYSVGINYIFIGN